MGTGEASMSLRGEGASILLKLYIKETLLNESALGGTDVTLLYTCVLCRSEIVFLQAVYISPSPSLYIAVHAKQIYNFIQICTA